MVHTLQNQWLLLSLKCVGHITKEPINAQEKDGIVNNSSGWGKWRLLTPSVSYWN